MVFEIRRTTFKMSKVKLAFSVLDRFIHDVQKYSAYPTPGEAKRASEAVDDIINNVKLIDELNVKGIRDLIKLAEKGKFTDMKNKIEEAVSDYQIIESTYKTKLLPTPQNYDKDRKSKAAEDSSVNKGHSGSMETEEITQRPHGQDLMNSRLLHQYHMEEETDRRSKEASIPMHNKNPMITDIGDINRPTKLAEQFSVLYDNEWTDAFDSVARMAGQTQSIEKDIIIYLADVLRNIFEYTVKRAPALVDNISSLLEQTMLDPVSSTKDKVINPSMIHSTKFHRYATECVKETAKLSIPALVMDFKKTDLRPGLQKYKENVYVNKYIDRCLEIMWLMNVQDPPMTLKWPIENQNTDEMLQRFRHFTKFGIQLDYVVWPALLLYEGGPLVVKGVVQMK